MTQIAANATKKDRVVAELRQLILSGAIPRGARIQQEDIAAQLQVSITPVREALRQLAAEGFVVGEPHKGVTVPLLDIEDVKAVYITRRLIEPYAFARASRRFSRLDLARAHELTDAMEAANLAGDPSGVSTANRDFHFLFFERCGIPGLTARLEELWDAFPWDMLMSTDRQHAVAEHRVILAAFEIDDLDALRAAVEEHLSRSYFRVFDFLTGAPSDTDPFALASS